MGLLSSIARGLRRVRSAIVERVRPAPGPGEQLSLQLRAPEPPARAAPVEPSPPPPLPGGQLELPLRPVSIAMPAPPELSDEEEQRMLLDTAEELASAYQPGEAEMQAASAELDALSSQAGDLSPESIDLLMRGHPLLLSPLELLERWGGMDREEALEALAARELDGVQAAAELADIRGPALARWRKAMEQEAPKGPDKGAGMGGGRETPAETPLQGGDFERAGLTPDEAVRAAWSAWLRSTLAQVGGDQAIEISLEGDLFRVPMHVWRRGPEEILEWLKLANGGRAPQGPTVARINGWRKPQSPKSRRPAGGGPRRSRTPEQRRRHAEREKARRAARSPEQIERDRAARRERYQRDKARRESEKP